MLENYLSILKWTFLAGNKRCDEEINQILNSSFDIDVDIEFRCGRRKCARTRANECFDMLNKEYKFYLAFENSNCREYITEKFFVNGLGYEI